MVSHKKIMSWQHNYPGGFKYFRMELDLRNQTTTVQGHLWIQIFEQKLHQRVSLAQALMISWGPRGAANWSMCTMMM